MAPDLTEAELSTSLALRPQIAARVPRRRRPISRRCGRRRGARAPDAHPPRHRRNRQSSHGSRWSGRDRARCPDRHRYKEARMSSDLVTYELDGAVALVRLNRPKKRNAINNAVVMQLRDAVGAPAEADAGVIFGHGVRRPRPRRTAAENGVAAAQSPITLGTKCSTSSRAARSPSSRRCTARWSAAAWKQRRPISVADHRSSACPRASAAFSSAAAAPFAFSALSAVR